MKPSPPDLAFSDSRLRVLLLLRGPERTVKELAEELGLTPNAIRSHLKHLEKQGLVRAGSLKSGHRKPHVTYVLTPEAERVFPKRYDKVLSALLGILGEKLPPAVIEATLSEVATRLAQQTPSCPPGTSLAGRLAAALAAIADLGGSARIEQQNGKTVLQGYDCPLARLVPCFPAACQVAEQLLRKVSGLDLKEHCLKGPHPRCRFELACSA